MLRTFWGVSVTKGRPPASAKRPITATRPGPKTTALERWAPRLLLSKTPIRQSPLA